MSFNQGKVFKNKRWNGYTVRAFLHQRGKPYSAYWMYLVIDPQEAIIGRHRRKLDAVAQVETFAAPKALREKYEKHKK